MNGTEIESQSQGQTCDLAKILDLVTEVLSTAGDPVLRRGQRDFSRDGTLTPDLLVVLLLFMAGNANRRGYRHILDAFWDECGSHSIRLPSEKPVSAAAFCQATRDDGPWDMMRDENGVATVVGSTVSFDYPTTPNAYDSTYGANGLADACLSQLELQADGLVRFGRGTRSCTGPVLLRGTAMPRMGNVGFTILSTNTPPSSAGALLLADRRLQNSIVFAGAELWIDPGVAVILGVTSSDLQRSDTAMPIPAIGGLVGGRVFAQTVWVGPSSPPPCPPFGLSTSFGLEITVQP